MITHEQARMMSTDELETSDYLRKYPLSLTLAIYVGILALGFLVMVF